MAAAGRSVAPKGRVDHHVYPSPTDDLLAAQKALVLVARLLGGPRRRHGPGLDVHCHLGIGDSPSLGAQSAPV